MLQCRGKRAASVGRVVNSVPNFQPVSVVGRIIRYVSRGVVTRIANARDVSPGGTNDYCLIHCKSSEQCVVQTIVVSDRSNDFRPPVVERTEWATVRSAGNPVIPRHFITARRICRRGIKP